MHAVTYAYILCKKTSPTMLFSSVKTNMWKTDALEQHGVVAGVQRREVENVKSKNIQTLLLRMKDNVVDGGVLLLMRKYLYLRSRT